jgi:hypothetical protein
VAGWQWLGWTGNELVIILRGGKLGIGAVLAVAGWQWVDRLGFDLGIILRGDFVTIGAVLF